MNAWRTALILPLLLLVSGGFLWAASKYGSAVVKKGSMTVVRDGRSLRFNQAAKEITINENDLIRVKRRSSVVLDSRERARMTLGSNAVFHVKPWQSKGKTGFLRALFGKFRASVVGLLGGEQFNVRTATATIGVKGTEYQSQITNRGGTLVIVRESTVGFQGQRGAEVDIGENIISITININPPTPPVPLPPELRDRFRPDDLDAPDPNGPQGGDFTGEDGLVRAGIVSEDELNEGKGDGVPGAPPVFTPPRISFDPNEANDALQRAKVRLNGF